jgi:YD repeat-containing protein
VLEKHRPASTDVVRRSVNYEYDVNHGGTGPVPKVYRLTQESLFNSAGAGAGTIDYVYDLVGNRTDRTLAAAISPAPVDAINNQAGMRFDRLDRIDNDTDPNTISTRYDASGNTINENGTATGDLYDAENRLIARGSTIKIKYDYAGNRVSKTVNGVTTWYLVDELNPTGYSQTLAEYTQTEPSATGLMGYWKMEDGTGMTATDSSSNGRNGTLNNGPVWTTGFNNSGLFFDGIDDWASVPSSAGLHLNSMTVAFWVRKSAEPSASVRLVGKGTAASQNYGVWEEGTSHKIRFQFKTTSGTDLDLAKAALLQPLGADPQARAVPVENLDPVAPAIGEDEQMPAQRVLLQLMPHQPAQPFETLAQIRHARREIHARGHAQGHHNRASSRHRLDASSRLKLRGSSSTAPFAKRTM